MYNTGIFSKFCQWEWDLSTGKWDFEKKMGWEMGLVPPPPPSPFRTVRKQSCPGTTTKSTIAIKQPTLRFMQHHSYLSNAQKPFSIVFPQSTEFTEVRYESPQWSCHLVGQTDAALSYLEGLRCQTEQGPYTAFGIHRCSSGFPLHITCRQGKCFSILLDRLSSQEVWDKCLKEIRKRVKNQHQSKPVGDPWIIV